jgi:hypothetical protein
MIYNPCSYTTIHVVILQSMYRYSDNYLVPLGYSSSQTTALAVGCFEIIFMKIYSYTKHCYKRSLVSF